MLVIRCPFCGPRPEVEFAYGGPVRAPRPDPAATDDAAWVDHLTVVPNPQGVVQERWHHVHGCGQWLTVWRHTVTHDIDEGPTDGGV